MKNAPGYPLPTGELGEDEIVCQLVYLPDRPEYWQAFLGALSYMTTWKAWERDSDKRGADAAANWREAFELTMECWRMTCLEDLKDDVAAILAIMQIPQACCDAGDVTGGDQYTDRVEDGVGDVPQNIIDAGYATGTSDWAGFDDYKCMIAHVTVNQLEWRLDEIAKLVDTSGAILGGVTALAGILAVIFATGGLAIVFGIVAGVGATSLLYQALTDFDWVATLSDKVATNHDDLACAIYWGDGDDGSLVALNASIDENFTALEAAILKNMNLGPTLKALYAGRYDQQDVAEILEAEGYDVLDFECDCPAPPLGEVEYDKTWILRTTPPDNWTGGALAWIENRIDWNGQIWYTKSQASTGVSHMSLLTNRFEASLGLVGGAHDDIYIATARVYLKHNGVGTEDLVVSVFYEDATWDVTYIPASIGGSYQWQDITVNPAKLILKTESANMFRFYTAAVGVPQNQFWVETLEISGSYTVL